jgi:soluble lytic murein transglycosylase-like protein
VSAAHRADGVTARIRSLNRSLSNAEARRIWRAVDRYSAEYELAPDLVLGVLEVESGARVGARSSKGALGLMQVMPHMASALALAGNHTTIESNIEAGCLILAHNIRRLGEEDGVSAYFWGSEIRGVGYLNRVSSAREAYRRILAP